MGWVKSTAAYIFTGKRADDARYHYSDSPTSDFWYGYQPAGSGTGIKVTTERAQQVAAVYRCAYIFADALTLPLSMYRLRIPGILDGGMDVEPTHPMHDILTLNPNRKDTAASFWRTMGWHSALRGVSYAEIKPGKRGFADRLIPIHPDRVRPELIEDDVIRYRVTDRSGVERTLLQEEMFRIPGLMPDGFCPLSPSRMATESVGLAIALEQHAVRIFSQSINLGGVFTHPGKLTESAVERLRHELGRKFMGIGNLFKPMILQEGLKYEKAAMTAREAQLVDERKWQISEIARVFGGVPLHMLGMDDSTNRSTVEEQSLNFTRFVIRPWIENVEQAIRHDLILAPKLYVAKFNLDELQRGNMGAQGEFYAKMSGAGGSPQILTINEIRGALGWNPSSEEHANKLAMGTNPETQPTGTPPAALEIGTDTSVEEPRALPSPETAAEKPPMSSKERMGRRHIAKLRKLVELHGDNVPALNKAARSMYNGFRSQFMQAMNCSKEVAKAWVDDHCSRVIESNDVNATIDTFEVELEEELRRLGEQNG